MNARCPSCHGSGKFTVMYTERTFIMIDAGTGDVLNREGPTAASYGLWTCAGCSHTWRKAVPSPPPRPPLYTHLTGKAAATRGYVEGSPVTTLCGLTMVPTRDPAKLDIETCPGCLGRAAEGFIPSAIE